MIFKLFWIGYLLMGVKFLDNWIDGLVGLGSGWFCFIGIMREDLILLSMEVVSFWRGFKWWWVGLSLIGDGGDVVGEVRRGGKFGGFVVFLKGLLMRSWDLVIFVCLICGCKWKCEDVFGGRRLEWRECCMVVRLEWSEWYFVL